jgi:hypothetical protein
MLFTFVFVLCSIAKGWITDHVFRQWIEKVFVKETKASLENPVLLLLDNHRSRYNIDTMRYARANGVHMLTYPANATHFIQVRTAYIPSGLMYHHSLIIYVIHRFWIVCLVM